MPSVPFRGDDGNPLAEVLRKPEPKGAWERLSQFIPPAAREQYAGYAQAIPQILGPGADLKDVLAGGGEVSRGLLGLAPARAGMGAANMAGGLAAMFVPGSVSGMRGMVRATDDAMGAGKAVRIEPRRVEELLDAHGVEYRKDVSQLTNGFPSHYYYVKGKGGQTLKLRVADHPGNDPYNDFDLADYGSMDAGVGVALRKLGIEPAGDARSAADAWDAERRAAEEARAQALASRVPTRRDADNELLRAAGLEHLVFADKARRQEALRKLRQK